MGKAEKNITVRAILFDMDGVLISSIEADERSWLRWARLHGMENSFSIHDTHGRRSVDTIAAIRPDLDVGVELSRMEDFDAEDCEGIRVYPGAVELLAELPAAQWSIVTSASERVMRNRLGVMGVKIPQHIVTADRVNRGKPSPDPYLLGAKQLGVEPGDCLVIEDAPSGIRAGKAAGCAVLAVASSHAVEELKEADWVMESLRDLQVEVRESGEIYCSFSVQQN
jgi:sugar-phosphatase